MNSIRFGQRYWFDTEFVDNPKSKTTQFISIGVVAEDGREFYAVNKNFRATPTIKSLPVFEWLQENVFSRLGLGDYQNGRVPRMSRDEIKDQLLDFIGDDKTPEFWAYNGAYDWYNVCKLFGAMLYMPDDKKWSFFDIKPLAQQVGLSRRDFPRKNPANEHNALADARWDRAVWTLAKDKAERLGIPLPGLQA